VQEWLTKYITCSNRAWYQSTMNSPRLPCYRDCMNLSRLPVACGLLLAIGLSACANGAPSDPMTSSPFTFERRTEHSGDDDLLSAGLGLAGLRSAAPPTFAVPDAPTAQELRRRALWSTWRGLADLSLGAGYGELYGNLEPVPGREYSAYARLPGARHPYRVLVQIPQHFDTGKRCVLVAPASGSRGMYGGVPVAGAWGLPKGCAVAYTDKGAGSDYFDLEAGIGVRADGTLGRLGEVDDLAFVPEVTGEATGAALKHVHSKDNPEADWGRHVRQAAEYALVALNQERPEAAPFTFANTRIIAVGISNGGGAVLRAAELEGDWLDAVVAREPNVFSDGPGSRALYDYATEAALLMPCAHLHMQDLPQPPLTAVVQATGLQRCATLAAERLIGGATPAEQAKTAYDLMRSQGWTDAALRAGALSTGFELWRSVAVTYASAYGRFGVGEHPCGFTLGARTALEELQYRAAPGAAPARRSFTQDERAAWWSEGNGIAPDASVGIFDPHLQPPDPTWPGLQCLRALWTGDDANARRVKAGIDAIRADLPREGLPVLVVHGLDDGLIPVAFSSAPYVAAANAAGREVHYWQIANVQHFDGFLVLPDYAARYRPLLPHLYAALDRVSEHLDTGTALSDATIAATPRNAGQSLDAQQLEIAPR